MLHQAKGFGAFHLEKIDYLGVFIYEPDKKCYEGFHLYPL